MALFRKQASEAQTQRLFGEVSLSVAPSSRHLTLVFTALFVVVIVFLFTNSYHRKQMVVGHLKPSKSIVTTRSPGRFIVSDVFVEIGQSVAPGDPIIALTSVDGLTNESRFYAQTLTNLVKHRDNLRDQLNDLEHWQKLNSQKLSEQLTQNRQAQELKGQQLDVLVQRIELKIDQKKEAETLQEKGHITKEQLNLITGQLLALIQQKAELQLQHTELQHQQQLTEAEHLELPLARRKEQRQIQSNLATVDSQILELKSRNELVLTASKSGFISNIAAKTHEIIEQHQYLYTLAPVSSELYAELMIPSRAMGFVKPGQKARLKIDAFPYQKFGAIDAVIMKAATTTVLSNSLISPFKFEEPVYIVTAKLNRQQLTAFKQSHKLQAGMLLSADILLEQRTLTEWLLEPLFSLKG